MVSLATWTVTARLVRVTARSARMIFQRRDKAPVSRWGHGSPAARRGVAGRDQRRRPGRGLEGPWTRGGPDPGRT
ncbi:hypothetical protein JCM13210_10230 [Thermaerobacter litoralis]